MKSKEKNTKKTVDAVQFMREQRDRISKDVMNLSPDEIVKYFKQKKSKTQIKPSANKSLFVPPMGQG